MHDRLYVDGALRYDVSRCVAAQDTLAQVIDARAHLPKGPAEGYLHEKDARYLLGVIDFDQHGETRNRS